jgi:lysophospholipase L1-like esterase
MVFTNEVLTVLLYHIYSGQLFFSTAIVFVAIVAFDISRWLDTRPLARRVAAVLALLAIPLAGMSGTPLPLFLAVPTIVATLTYVFVGFGARPTVRRVLGAIAIITVLVAVTSEFPYHLSRPVSHRASEVFVVGDSLASGGFGELRPWPEVLGRHLDIPVTNLALPSDNASMALRNQVPHLSTSARVDQYVIVEIGGNDMLDGTPAKQFATALDQILTRASAGGRRQVILLELPLLPGRWQYGAIQRRLAAKHKGILVPKRILACVLLGKENTFDGIHLTQQGHDALAKELVRSLSWDVAQRQ